MAINNNNVGHMRTLWRKLFKSRIHVLLKIVLGLSAQPAQTLGAVTHILPPIYLKAAWEKERQRGKPQAAIGQHIL